MSGYSFDKSLKSSSSLPSLATNLPRSRILDSDFAVSVPIFRKGRYDVFGANDQPMPERIGKDKSIEKKKTYNYNIKSPPKKVNNLVSAGILSINNSDEVKLKPITTTGSNKVSSKKKDSYAVRRSQAGDDLMKSEGDRKQRLEQAKELKKVRAGRSRITRTYTVTSELSVSNESLGSADCSASITDGDSIASQMTMDSIERAQTEMEKVFEYYVGEKSRTEFITKFKTASLDLGRYQSDDNLPAEKKTPRSMYLRETAKNNLLPLPLVLRKANNPLGLFLGHRGLGDAKLMPVIKVIMQLPGVSSIDLSDNRLTDKTLMPLAMKLSQMRCLTYLDLSFNKVDECSATIMDFLRSKDCVLQTLMLSGADVDDAECVNICQAVSLNTSLRCMSLSHNLIGVAEQMNVLKPDLITGGEAIGEMLSINTTLTKLDLSWNSIRLESAIALAKSLEVNSTLRSLLLGYNSFGDIPVQVLGKALKSNKSLMELDIESNSITPKAATVLANAISFNETLEVLNINGNVLGKIGAQALVAAIQRSSTEKRLLQVSFVNCDCSKDDVAIFSAANPHGTWRLNLAEPYGQMVAAECLYLANYKAGCRIVKLFYEGELVILERAYVATHDEGDEGNKKKFKLEEFYRCSREAAEKLLEGNMNDASRALQQLLSFFDFRMEDDVRLSVLKKTADLWAIKSKREGRDDLHEVFLYEIFFSLFVINDADMSGTMELDEFLETLDALGKKNFDRDSAKRLMLEHDRDESGSIDANEFGTIMLNEFCVTDLPKGDLVDSRTGLPWEIPSTGNCVIQLSYQCDVPTLFDIGEDHGIESIIQSIRDAKTDEQREILFQNTTSSPYFFLSFEQAQLLFEEMQGLNKLPLELMASILPQIVNVEQANKFIETNLNDKGKFALRVKLGQLYNSYIGNHTGHYAIDLKNQEERNGGRRLGAISVTEGKFCRQQGMVSSQKGNASNFRNEKLGVTPVDVTGRWFASCESNKVLHFDYISCEKPLKGTPPLSDSKFEQLTEEILRLQDIRDLWDKLHLRDMQYFSYLHRLEEAERQLKDGQSSPGKPNSSYPQSGLKTPPRTSEGKAASRHISGQKLSKAMSMSSMLDGNPHDAGTGYGRSNSHTMLQQSYAPSTIAQLTTAQLKAQAKLQLQQAPPFSQLKSGFIITDAEFPLLAMEAPLTVTVLRDTFQEYMETCHHFYDIFPEERMRDVSRMNYSATERPPTPELMKNEPAPSKTYLSPIFPLVYRKLIELQIILPSLNFSVQQVAELLSYLPPEEGYMRIQLLQTVYNHITDLENMHFIFDCVLTQDERNEAIHRIGIMNLLNPLHPDRFYRLDLRKPDQREFVKILVCLAIAEPGDNWEGVEYRWGKYDDPVPGWSLPASWAYADDGGNNGGPRTFGWITLTYRSSGNGCHPVYSVRKHLRKRTLAGLKKII